jgi:hypothetical protein
MGYMYLDGWKEILPVDKVHVPRQPGGHPSEDLIIFGWWYWYIT